MRFSFLEKSFISPLTDGHPGQIFHFKFARENHKIEKR
jgi:hypothetical protein